MRRHSAPEFRKISDNAPATLDPPWTIRAPEDAITELQNAYKPYTSKSSLKTSKKQEISKTESSAAESTVTDELEIEVCMKPIRTNRHTEAFPQARHSSRPKQGKTGCTKKTERIVYKEEAPAPDTRQHGPEMILQNSSSSTCSSVWTDSEHRSYLDCIEANFVNSMYQKRYCDVDICGEEARPWKRNCLEEDDWKSSSINSI